MSIHNIIASRGNILHGNSYTGVTDSAPYLFRPTGGNTAIGDAKVAFLNKLVGGTVAWNQLVKNGDFSNSTTNWSFGNATYSVTDGVLTVTKTAASGYGPNQRIPNTTSGIPTDHKVYKCVTFKGASGITYGFNGEFSSVTGDGQWHTYQRIINNTTANVYFNINSSAETSDFQPWYVKNIMYVDLTAMLGTAIADRAYALEQGTAGAGIAWLQSQGFDLSKYHAFNAGSLESVYTDSHKEYGFNQWDEQWDLKGINGNTGQVGSWTDRLSSKNYIPVMQLTDYYMTFTTGTFYLHCYDSNNNWLGRAIVYNGLDGYMTSSGKFTTRANTAYIKFASANSNAGTTYNKDICINLDKPTGTPKNGDYLPHTEVTYPITPNVLRGKLGLDANNNITYNGDERYPNGTINRKTAVVMDMGDLSWTESSSYSGMFYATLPYPAKNNGFTVSAHYLSREASTVANEDMTTGLYVTSSVNLVRLHNNTFHGYTNAQVQAALNGQELIYELATPTTETTDPYTNPQTVFVGGTEEFTDYGVAQGQRDVAIPVGHETEYYQEAV